MKKIISIIKQELVLIQEKLSNDISDKKTLIKEKKEIENILFQIDFCQKYGIQKDNIIKTFSLPYEENSGYGEYRIINDYETEDKEYWKELEINNELVRLYPHDIIVQKK